MLRSDEELNATVAPPQAEGTPELQDTQAQADRRGIRIDKVGVRGVRYPIMVRDRDGRSQSTVAMVGMYVDLPRDVRGTHMSRFIEILHAHENDIECASIGEILHEMQGRLMSETSHVEIEFPYFRTKRAPVSGQESLMDYTVRFDATAIREEVDIVLTVKVGVTTLCPCSKAISESGAHNQRGRVTVQVRTREAIWIEDLIEVVEKSASAELYALLKRSDEKAVTEQAWSNPVFVEDLIRNVVAKLNENGNVTWYKVEAENYESIHSHNAYACIEMG